VVLALIQIAITALTVLIAAVQAVVTRIAEVVTTIWTNRMFAGQIALCMAMGAALTQIVRLIRAIRAAAVAEAAAAQAPGPGLTAAATARVS